MQPAALRRPAVDGIACAAGQETGNAEARSSWTWGKHIDAAGNDRLPRSPGRLGAIESDGPVGFEASTLLRPESGASPTKAHPGPQTSGAYVALLLSAFTAGFAVTAVEIALGRLLAPFYGSGLLVWSAIIASVITALSVGYPMGGYVIDRFPDLRVPLLALAAGGILSTILGVSVPNWLRMTLRGVSFGGIDYWSSLVLALVCFSAPCSLLAMVSPAVIRLRLRSPEAAGRVAGSVYALGSVGSVLGILLTALYSIPRLGLRWTFVLIGVLGVCPLLLSFIGRGRRALWLSWLPCLVAGGILIPQTPSEPGLPGTRLVHEGDSAIQHIRVLSADQGPHRRRFLQLDEGWVFHSILFEPSLVTETVLDEMALSALFTAPPDGHVDVLIIGLAGGTVSNLMTRYLRDLVPELRITGVELDQGVIDVADTFMGLDRTLTQVEISDGRAWLRYSPDTFDLVIIDAYRQPSIPAHLATVEFFHEVAQHLSARGLAVLNLAAVPKGRVVGDVSATWNKVFEPAQIAVDLEEIGLTSHLLFGGPAVPLRFAEDSQHMVPPLLRPAWQRLRHQVRLIRTELGAEVWTDDRAPVELFADQAFRASRRDSRIQP